MSNFTFNSVPEVLKDLKLGKLVVVVDDESRENEGDLIGAADKCTPEMVNFMARYGRGLICTAITEERSRKLDLDLMVETDDNNALHQTPFTVSVDYVHGTTTGISATDRYKTIKALADPAIAASDLARPGHIFPLRATRGGVFRRDGHTEATVDLMELAELSPVGVLCEIMKEDGDMARLPDLKVFAKQHDLKILTIKELIKYRLRYESRVEHEVTVELPTCWGEFKISAFKDIYTDREHLALVHGSWKPDDDVLVRIHSECLTGDVFGSMRCDCGEQVRMAMDMVQQNQQGIIIYMRDEGRGIGLVNKLKAYALQEQGFDTVDANLELGFEADQRDYSVAAHMLRALEVKNVQLITNNPDKCEWMQAYNINLVNRIPMIAPTDSEYRRKYMQAKRDKMGHVIELKNIVPHWK
ncbi:MAG: bifunctional 3,4-dihydroxy-2-butanone-4-phosphate synthase/GTP cyclohydrolase II [Gammaproteobacteria bacterium]|nr:MAG: bifunctional 3,4-dihydroxy-2-butanone-4-phosphate synthase/GTP cyclohydrolase II [Gammaproteobacteria bacterium]